MNGWLWAALVVAALGGFCSAALYANARGSTADDFASGALFWLFVAVTVLGVAILGGIGGWVALMERL